MANETFTSVSDDNDVIQELHWDTVTEKIEVVHKLNLAARKDARLQTTNTYYPGVVFNQVALRYGLDSKQLGVITEFVYDEYINNDYEYDHVSIFPDERSSYPLTGMKQGVIVHLNRTTPTGTVSTTSGEIL